MQLVREVSGVAVMPVELSHPLRIPLVPDRAGRYCGDDNQPTKTIKVRAGFMSASASAAERQSPAAQSQVLGRLGANIGKPPVTG
jgi:hypothetical protein